MTEDTHAQANAEQVRVLREALSGTAGQEQGVPEREEPGPDPLLIADSSSPAAS